MPKTNLSSHEENLEKVVGLVEIPCLHGLHLRPASIVARTAQKFESDIVLIHEDRKFDAKSIMDILQIGPVQNNKLQVIATGQDATNAIMEITRLFESNELLCEEEIEERK